MSNMTAPPGGNVDRGPFIMATLWTQAAICVIIMAFRFGARMSINALGMDDWVMLFTLVKYYPLSRP